MIETLPLAFPALLSLYVMVCATLQVLFRETRQQLKLRQNLSVTILVPAHNEEAVLGACLESLLKCNHSPLEICVLSDGSTDRTAEIARSFASRGVCLHEFTTNVGKSNALEAALKNVATDLVMIVDADTRLESDTISEMVAAFDHDVIVGATANIQVKNANSILTRLQAVEYASIIGLMKRANSIWGGLFTVSGAASMFRTNAVREVGGFASSSITEDIELSWRLQSRGGKLAYAPTAIANIEVPPNWRALWHQRIRWSQGLTEVLRLHGGGMRSRNPALIVFALESFLCMGWLGALAGGLVFDVAANMTGHFTGVGINFWHLLSLTLFVCQTVMAAMLDSHYTRVSWLRLLVAVFYPIYFLALVMPTSLTGWWFGLSSENATRWQRCERIELLEAKT